MIPNRAEVEVRRPVQRHVSRLVLLGVAASALALSACGLGAARSEEADLQIITHGDKVDVEAHLARGKYTVIDFYAAWCPPCRVVGPALERLAKVEHSRLAVRKIDIVDWTMPVVEQYGIEALPHLMLFDPQGRRVANGDEVYRRLREVFGDAAREVIEAGEAAGADTSPGTPATDKDGATVL